MTELTPSCPSSREVLEVVRIGKDLCWRARGNPIAGGSVTYGAGYAADAHRFPPGTTLTVTAEIEMAEKGDGNGWD